MSTEQLELIKGWLESLGIAVTEKAVETIEFLWPLAIRRVITISSFWVILSCIGFYTVYRLYPIVKQNYKNSINDYEASEVVELQIMGTIVLALISLVTFGFHIIKINNAGGKLYLVGGAIRNSIIDYPIHDYDFCFEGISKEKFQKLFPEAQLVGNHFGVFILDGYEFAATRTERLKDNSQNRRDYNVKCNVSIEEDLKRRDFTVNAIAIDLTSGKVIDPYNGIKDAKNRKLKAFSNSFETDPLRVLRGARLFAQYPFYVEPNTIKRMSTMKEQLKNLPKERVFEEFKKAIKGDFPYNFFYVLKYTDLLDTWFKEIEDLIGVPQPKKYHREGSAYIHSILSLKNIAKRTNDPAVRFASLVHDLGKGLTPCKDYPHHYGHESKGIKPLNHLCDRLGIPNRWRKIAEIAVKYHMKGRLWKIMKPGKVVKLFKIINNSPIGMKDFKNIIISDLNSRNKENNDRAKELKGICKLYKSMFKNTGGKNIDSSKYSGKEFGERLFQYRCHWLNKERNKIKGG